jgi:hypothetical protein
MDLRVLSALASTVLVGPSHVGWARRASSHAQTFVALQCGWFLLVTKGLCALAPSFLFSKQTNSIL